MSPWPRGVFEVQAAGAARGCVVTPAQEKNNINGDAGFYQRLFTGLSTKVVTAPSKNLGFYLGLLASDFYLNNNLRAFQLQHA